MTNLPTRVRIVEVGPRDGLQNENKPVSIEDRIALVNRLSNAGFGTIEAGSFVSSDWIPQMAHSDQVIAGIKRRRGTRYSALTPNLTGLNAARQAGADGVAVFASASETFSKKNINCSIDESLDRFRPVLESAKEHNLPVRGYVSCAIDCPYEDAIAPDKVLTLSRQLLELGCYEIALSDTTGKGTPASFRRLLDTMTVAINADQLALHCHDTYGQALVNVYTSLEYGISVFDSSVAGLGGCPYAKGASGNLATEDLLYLLHDLGIETGIDLDKTIEAGNFITDILECPNRSSVSQARRASR